MRCPMAPALPPCQPPVVTMLRKVQDAPWLPLA
jgi:hypothetical protein